jgi:hypothetical protein
MTKFTLPLGAFQIHLATPPIMNAARALREAIGELDRAMQMAFDRGTDDVQAQMGALDRIAEGSIRSGIEAASQEFRRSLETLEFPQPLPKMTHQLIYASIVAQAFNLTFEIRDYELRADEKERAYWWVIGRAVDKRARVYENPGSSFMFPKDDEKVTEGALLSACTDACHPCAGRGPADIRGRTCRYSDSRDHGAFFTLPRK